MPVVFLSYRRVDTAGEAGRLSDGLRQKLSGRWVFRDVQDIAPGAQFGAVLEKELEDARLVLVLIGPAWLRELQHRLGQPDIDYLRVEVATALSKGKRVMPVLLKGAALPNAEELPDDLKSLTKRQALTIRDEAWNGDLDRLIEAIGRPYPWRRVAFRALLLLTAIVAAVRALFPHLSVDRARWLVVLLMGTYALVELSMVWHHCSRARKRGG